MIDEEKQVNDAAQFITESYELLDLFNSLDVNTCELIAIKCREGILRELSDIYLGEIYKWKDPSDHFKEF